MTDAQALRLLNQLFELEKKLLRQPDAASVLRPVERMKDVFGELGYSSHSPIGEFYDSSRTDLEASIAGQEGPKMMVKDVIKPIVFLRTDGGRRAILQKGIVIVEAV